MFEIKTYERSDGPRYAIVNTETGLPVVTWYNGDQPNELIDYRDRRKAEATLEDFTKGYLRDVRRSPSAG